MALTAPVACLAEVRAFAAVREAQVEDARVEGPEREPRCGDERLPILPGHSLAVGEPSHPWQNGCELLVQPGPAVQPEPPEPVVQPGQPGPSAPPEFRQLVVRLALLAQLELLVRPGLLLPRVDFRWDQVLRQVPASMGQRWATERVESRCEKDARTLRCGASSTHSPSGCQWDLLPGLRSADRAPRRSCKRP